MECESTSKKMVATLQSRKDALQAKLREKTQELKKLCIQEAELTGILPPETPIEAGESPPVFRRKVGTAFIYPENLIDKLKSKEEESVAKLELECKIQTSIAEAALGLANDGSANKSIRRKHRLEYQRSQRRLAELEMRLNVLRQSLKNGSQYQRKKPRPPLAEADCTDGTELASDELDNHFKHMHADEPMSLSFINRDVIRNSHFYNSFGKSSHNYPSYTHHPNGAYPPSKSNSWNRNQLYRRSVGRTHYNSGSYEDQSNWPEDSSLWRNTAPVGYFSNQCYTTLPNDVNHTKSRYGSLDRRYRTVSQSTAGGSDVDGLYPAASAAPPPPSRVSPAPSLQQRASPYTNLSRRGSSNCLPSPTDSPLVNAVLLPNQTYPENSLMRTQSLGNVEHTAPPCKSLDTHSLQEKLQESNFSCSTLGRRTREKEWRETSLDVDSYKQQQAQHHLEQQQAQHLLEQQQAQLQQQLQQQQTRLQEAQLQQQQAHQRRSQTPPLHPRAPPKVPVAESPVPQHQFARRGAQNTPPPLPPPHNSVPASPPPIVSKSPIKSPTLIESTVPFESPKNHTVVEVGKWQPYREVTKPFEMSDFYKYSTKFRKNTE